jgi:hypothetical protein
MIKVVFEIEGTSPYSQGRPVMSEHGKQEDFREFEERTWRERMHTASDGKVFIPPMAIKCCLQETAKYLSESIPGKGNNTYTKHFEAGIMVVDPMLLNVKAADVAGEWLFVPSDGTSGGGKRVWKCFPTIPAWNTSATIYILDPIITEEVFKNYVGYAGRFIGMGRFRPRKKGYYGRFVAKNFKFTKVTD